MLRWELIILSTKLVNRSIHVNIYAYHKLTAFVHSSQIELEFNLYPPTQLQDNPVVAMTTNKLIIVFLPSCDVTELSGQEAHERFPV